MRSPTHREISLLISHMRRIATAACNRRLALVNSSMPAYLVLFHLSHDEEASQHELATDLGMDRAGVSRLVQDMSRRGYVQVRTDPADKRQRFVRITAKGRKLEVTLSPIVDQVLAPFSSGLTETEEGELLRLLRKAHTACVNAAQLDESAARATRKPVSDEKPARAPATKRRPLQARRTV